jgi:hypothetical protein
MTVSMILGRTGSVAEGTGLYLMEGALGSMHILEQDVLKIADGPGVVLSAPQPFKNMEGVFFINKLPTFFYKKHDFLTEVAEVIDMETGEWMDTESSLFTSFGNYTIQKRPKLWTNEVLGLAPFGRAVKVILKHKRVQQARAAIFATGVDASEGGRTWVISNNGFASHTKKPSILAEGAPSDFTDSQTTVDGQPNTAMIITNAVAFMTGPKRRQPDEKSARLLEYRFNKDAHDAGLDKFLSDYVSMADDTVLGAGIKMMVRCAEEVAQNGLADVSLFDEEDSFLELEDEEML